MPIPTYQELLEQSGVDPKYFGEGGAGLFAGHLGLEGKQMEGFQKFADIMKFDSNKIKDLITSLGDFRTEQRGFVQEQFGSGLTSLRTNLTGQMTSAREQTGGFAGSGAQQRTMGLIGQAGQRSFGGLKQARTRGYSGIEEQVGARTGQIQGLLGDYIGRLTQLGGQFLSLDPGEEKTPPAIPPTAEAQQYAAKEEWYKLGFKDKESWQLWVDAGSDYSNIKSYGGDAEAILERLNITGNVIEASDVRLKKDIKYMFTMKNGVPIYTFKYKWSDDVNIGTMAQDIEGFMPEAVGEVNGFKTVNYSKVFNYGK